MIAVTIPSFFATKAQCIEWVTFDFKYSQQEEKKDEPSPSQANWLQWRSNGGSSSEIFDLEQELLVDVIIQFDSGDHHVYEDR